MCKRVICECVDQECTCEGKCIREARTVVVAKDDGKSTQAVCHSCGDHAVAQHRFNYSASAEEAMTQRV